MPRQSPLHKLLLDVDSCLLRTLREADEQEQTTIRSCQKKLQKQILTAYQVCHCQVVHLFVSSVELAPASSVSTYYARKDAGHFILGKQRTSSGQ